MKNISFIPNMKHDVGLKIFGERVVLVPYRREHVAKYHDWMGDAEILHLTGSERLTLQEEFEMQKTWEEDADKCTFIILNRDLYEKSADEVHSMVGDTNLFLNSNDDNHDETVGEIEIMIADKKFRRKGLASEALKLMMDYARQNLGKRKFLAKIKQDNESSIKLFERLGYKFVSKSDVFEEITLLYE
ncbi:N-acetyltransferase 9 isoform X2 [Folsomia candida]|nr:N-acetyltransferase 9 isoform X2 [Folsomia candida]